MNNVPPSKCPSCGITNDAATSAENDGAIPNHGDISICFNCGAINQFDEKLQIKKMDEEQLNSFDEETQKMVLSASRSIQWMKRFKLKP